MNALYYTSRGEAGLDTLCFPIMLFSFLQPFRGPGHLRPNQRIDLVWRKLTRHTLLFSALHATVWGQTSTVDYSAIVEKLRAGNNSEAIALIHQAEMATPKDPRLFLYEGVALSATGDVAGARAAYERSLQLNPNFVPALESVAQLEYQAGSERAQPLLEHLLRLEPGQPTARAMLGHLAFVRGDCESVLRYYSLDNAQVTAQPAALEEYGKCFARDREPDRAVQVFERLVAMRPRDESALLQLAATQMMADDPTNAISTVEKMRALGSLPPPAAMVAASVYEALGKTPVAVAILRQAIVESPDTVDLYTQFARSQLRSPVFPGGDRRVECGPYSDPDSSSLLYARGVLYVQMANYTAAEADFQQAAEMDPKSSAMSAEALTLADVQRDNLDEALVSAREKLKADGNNAPLLSLKAEILSQQGASPGSPAYDEALSAAKEAVRLNPRLATAHDLLAKLYLADGKLDETIAQSRLALRLDSTDDVAIYHLLAALRRSEGDHRNELKSLVEQLAAARERKRQQEADANRYKLVEESYDKH